MSGSQLSQQTQSEIKRHHGFGSSVREPKSFGRRHEPTTVTINRAGNVRHFTIRPVFLTLAVSVAAVFMIGYLGATAYLVFRDQLIDASRTHNARLLREYESRIATLRANLDQVTSRQLLDQQEIESKIDTLMQRQEMLRERKGKIGLLLEKAEKQGLTVDTPGSSSSDRTGDKAAADGNATDPVRTGSISIEGTTRLASAGGVPLRSGHDMMAGDRAKGTNGIAANEKLFSGLSARIENVNASQHAMLVDIHRAASARNAKIAKVLKRLHVPLPEGAGENGGDNSQMGGPFIAASLASFDSNIETLDGTLDELDTMTARLDKVPLANPAPGHPVTSTFGVRIDPFLKREAMHTGIDFGAPIGMRVKATAAGTVVEADRNGGYGNMVEIDHGGGIATRYAHLSAIMVKVGQKVERGTVIGLVGSTGRSTGPHLHYEVRRKGNAVNPARYLKAGRELAGII